MTTPSTSEPVFVTFLGGLGEIGRNCAVIEQDDKYLLIDCGLMFPDSDMLGIDLVLPDFTWLLEEPERIVGCVLTHGHEDHVGALSYLLRDASFPIYGTEFTLGLAGARIEESGLLSQTELIAVGDNQRRQIGPFDVEFIPATHSVPQGVAVAIHTAQGVILHSGDFKLDLTPVDGRLTNLARVGALADGEGIRLLLADSTNADQPGHARSERSVGRVLYDLMRDLRGRRIIVACFASHIHRIQQLAEAAIEQGRVIAPLGRSMKRNMSLARKMGLLHIPDSAIVDIDEVSNLDPGNVMVLCTGSQGEPMSALTLLSANENRWLQISEHDTVIFSSHPIPGNENAVTKVIDNLFRLGADVVYSGISDVHATGHAKAEELKLYHSIAQPEWFVPVHGEYHHLVAHARLAADMGVSESNIVIAEDGDRLRIDETGVRQDSRVPAEYIYVDGTVGDVGRGVLRDRRILADEGVVSVIVCVEFEDESDAPSRPQANELGLRRATLVAGPEIVTRGWIYEPESETLIDEMTAEVKKALEEALRSEIDLAGIQRVARRTAGKMVADRTRRRPMIVPVVLEA